MDFKKYNKIKEDLNHYDERINTLNELLNETKQKRQVICDECSHDFVLIYAKENQNNDDPEWSIHKHAQCLVCGSYIRLSKNNIAWDTDKPLNSNHIIDATEFASEYSQNLYQGSDNALYIAAKKEFDKLLDADTGHLKDKTYMELITLAVKKLDEENRHKEAFRRAQHEKIKK